MENKILNLTFKQRKVLATFRVRPIADWLLPTTRIGLALNIENVYTKYTDGWPYIETIQIVGDCAKVFPLLKKNSFTADCFTLNPPFSLHWTAPPTAFPTSPIQYRP